MDISVCTMFACINMVIFFALDIRCRVFRSCKRRLQCLFAFHTPVSIMTVQASIFNSCEAHEDLSTD